MNSADAQHDAAAASSSAGIAFITNIIPHFSLRDLALWLTKRKAMFKIRNIIRSATKFAYIQASISHAVANKFNLLIQPPAEEAYERQRNYF